MMEKLRKKTFEEILYYLSRHLIGRKASRQISWAFYKLCRNLPLRDDIIIFRTEGDFCDNGRALYEYMMTQTDKKRTFVWIVKEPSLYAKRANTIFISPDKGFLLKYFYYLAIAKNIIETHNLTQIDIRPGQNYICLWHGMVMKKPKAPSTDYHKKPLFNYLLNSSVNTVHNQARFFGIDESRVVSLGFPRNDTLIKSKAPGTENQFLEGRRYNKVIIWMPTFRASINSMLSETSIDTETGLPLIKDISSLLSISHFCQSSNILLIIKIHHLQATKAVFKMHFDNIRFIQDEELWSKDIQLYDMMAKTDAMITDYSSVFIDYLLLDKPMGFIATDFEQYEQSRGVPFDNFIEMLPGQLIYTINDFKDFIMNVLENQDPYKNKRDDLLPKVHDYIDGRSCERIKNYFNL